MPAWFVQCPSPLRELVFLWEHDKLEWAGEMIRLLVVMKTCVDRAKARQQCGLAPKLQQLLFQRYDALLEAGFNQDEPLQTDEPMPIAPKGEVERNGAKQRICWIG